MKESHSHQHEHRHAFGQDQVRPGERRTLWVIALTATMMVVEIAAGISYGSMALLADGLHMASHTAALAITAFAYIYTRRHAYDPAYSFGSGKANALGGFTGAVLLAVFALIMAGESLHRLYNPVAIAFNEAIVVSVLGLLVNGASMFILGDHGHDHHHEGQEHDHNLRSAYLHVLADALTSVLAIFALLAAKYAGLVWMDPLMGVVGAILVARWSFGLARSSSDVLLDRQADEELQTLIRKAIEIDGSQVSKLHLWSIGPGVHALILVVASSTPEAPEVYKSRLPPGLGLEHISVEIHLQEPAH